MTEPAELSQTPVVILAGGLGTRLRPVLADRPKALAPVGPRSFLEIQLGLLRNQGASHFVLCVGHGADQIQTAFGDGRRLGVRIDYSVETGPLLGTAGALKLAERFFRPRALVLNGDTYFDIDYAQLVRLHLRRRTEARALATLLLAPAFERDRYSNIALDESGEFVAAYTEKPTAQPEGAAWVGAGAYVIERELLDHVPAGRAVSLEREVLPALLADGRPLAAMTARGRFYDIGTPDGWRTFAERYAGQP